MNDGAVKISSDKSVLGAFECSSTHAVCWTPDKDDLWFSSLLSLADRYRDAVRRDPDRLTDRVTQVGRSMVALANEIKPLIDDVAAKKDFSLLAGRVGFALRSQGIGGTEMPADKTYRPHIDHRRMRAFISLNRHMGSTNIISPEYTGLLRDVFFFPNARLDKAESLPGLSVSLIDLGRQPHFRPRTPDPKVLRVFLTADYEF